MPTEIERRAMELCDTLVAAGKTLAVSRDSSACEDRVFVEAAFRRIAVARHAIAAALQAQQSGAQAVAWHTDDYLTDKSATTYDPVVADRWHAKGWPVTPLYLAPQPPSIPEPSEADVELAWSTLRSTTQPRDSCACDGDMRAVLSGFAARLRERVGQAPGGDGDAS